MLIISQRRKVDAISSLSLKDQLGWQSFQTMLNNHENAAQTREFWIW